MIDSVTPSPTLRPYTLAVSKKLRPCSSARSITTQLSSSLVSGPKFIVPRQSRLTTRPVRPRFVYSMTPKVTGSAALAGRCATEQDVVPARQPLARLVPGRLVAAGRRRGGIAPRPQHGERRHGRDLLGRVGVVVKRRAADQRGRAPSARPVRV